MSSNINNAELRSLAGSMVMEKPKQKFERRDDGGNVQLMEARLLELYSSLRALYRSNQELKDALENDPTTNPDDPDFLQAIEENWSTIRKQRDLSMELVSEMRLRGMNIDMPDDIISMEVPAHTTTTTETAGTKATATTSGGGEDAVVVDDDGGVYL